MVSRGLWSISQTSILLPTESEPKTANFHDVHARFQITTAQSSLAVWRWRKCERIVRAPFMGILTLQTVNPIPAREPCPPTALCNFLPDPSPCALL
eukprot:m.27654 g.27654  ORF g.27654 m.27654 type:complete len:96 (-) comp6452_c0_seq1:1980-2267(-)